MGIQLPETGGDAKNFFHEGRAIFDYIFFEGDKIQVINPYSNLIGFSMVYSGEKMVILYGKTLSSSHMKKQNVHIQLMMQKRLS